MPAINPFQSNSPATISPAIRMLSITPADADLSYVCRMLYVGNGGDVTVRDLYGTVVTHVGVAAGSYIGPFAIDRVTAASTATAIVGYV